MSSKSMTTAVADAGHAAASRRTRHVESSYLAGLFAGFAQTIVGHPFDTIKVRLQTGDFKGPLDCMRQTARHEGMAGFFAGMSSPLVSSIVFSSILFGSFEGFKELFSHRGEDEKKTLSTMGLVAACFATGAIETTCYCPFEHIKTRLQTQYGQSGQSLWHVVRQIYARSGIRGIYVGYTAQLWRECPGNIVYFGSYTWARDFLASRSESQRVLLAGGFSGMCYWFFTYPMDVVKSRMQADKMGEARRYKGFTDCIRVTYQELGIRGFFRGLSPCLVRAFPANAAAFGAFEYVKYLVDNDAVPLSLD